MEKVKITKDLYVEQSGTNYREGEEVEVPKYLADRHKNTGHMLIIDEKPDKPIALDKKTSK